MNPATAPPTPSSLNRALGDYGEQLATRYLREQGLTIIERNWRCARGEIDIVAMEGDCIVVCEVKTRTSEAFGAPFEAVNRLKKGRLYQLAGMWRDQAKAEHRGRGLRVDVISIMRPSHGPTRLRHLRCV